MQTPILASALSAVGPKRLAGIAAAWLFVSISASASWGRAAAWELVAADWIVGFFWAVAGLVIWIRRPSTLVGPLMILIGFVWFNGDFVSAGSEWTALYAHLFENLHVALLVGLIFAYPVGRIERRSERLAVAAVAGFVVIERLITAVVMPRTWGWDVCNLCDGEPLFFRNPIAAGNAPTLLNAVQSAEPWLITALASAVIVLLVRRFWRGSGAERRTLAPAWIAVVLLATYFIIDAIVIDDDIPRRGQVAFVWTGNVAASLIPIVFLAGLLHLRLLRGPIGRLVDDLEALPEGDALQEAIGRALGDPSAQVLYSLEDGSGYADSQGRPAIPPAPGHGRAVTPLSRRGADLGVLVHDESLLGRPELVATVCSAASLALANERLQAQVRAQLVEVEASRTRIVQAGDAERRRIERNLHDGAQQRLVALRIDLAIAAQGAVGDPELAARLTASARELDAAIAELRELARGIHPAVLTDEGLAAAAQVLVERISLPVTLEIEMPSRPPQDMEAAAYYVVAESLSNVSKHASASFARVSVTKQADCLVVRIEDNGVGGTDVGKGTGLVGLADRVAALGGRLEITSPAGAGTIVRAEFPWAAQ